MSAVRVGLCGGCSVAPRILVINVCLSAIAHIHLVLFQIHMDSLMR